MTDSILTLRPYLNDYVLIALLLAALVIKVYIYITLAIFTAKAWQLIHRWTYGGKL